MGIGDATREGSPVLETSVVFEFVLEGVEADGMASSGGYESPTVMLGMDGFSEERVVVEASPLD